MGNPRWAPQQMHNKNGLLQDWASLVAQTI